MPARRVPASLHELDGVRPLDLILGTNVGALNPQGHLYFGAAPNAVTLSRTETDALNLPRPQITLADLPNPVSA